MKQRLGYSFSIVILLLSFQAAAQETTVVETSSQTDIEQLAEEEQYADSVEEANDNFDFSIFIDYGKILTLPFGFEKKYEAGIAVKFNKKWSIGAEGGKADIYPLRPFKNGDSEVTGQYYSGFINYHMNIDQINSLFIGLGYGTSTFDDYITYTIANPLWEDYTEEVRRENMNATWFSIRFGSEQKLTDLIKLGGVFDFRIKHKLEKPEGLTPYSIPGYGQSNNTTSPALNLYISFTIL